MNPKEILEGSKYTITGTKGHYFKKGETVVCIKKYPIDPSFLYSNGKKEQFVNSEDVTPYIESIEESSDYSTLELAARCQYENVGYDKDDGTMSLYIKGALFGANWQKEQSKALQESHNKLLEALEMMYNTSEPYDVVSHKKVTVNNEEFDLGEFHVSGCGIPSNKAIHKAKNAIENAKNYAKKQVIQTKHS